MIKAWKQVASKYIHRESWFKLRSDAVIKGNGEPMDPYYVLEYTDWVNVFPVLENGKVILVRQYRYGLGAFSIEVPGGIMDPHETHPEEAARRELLEETGLTCGSIERVAVVAPNPATQNNRLHCFLATGCVKTHEIAHDENEEMDILEVEMDEVLRMLRENEIIQSLHVSSIMYSLQQLGKVKIG